MNYSAIAHVLYQKKVGYIEEKPQVTIHGLNVGKNSWEKGRIRSAPTQQNVEFGQDDIAARPVAEVSRDTLIGKIAEVAFSKLMRENYGIIIDLDLLNFIQYFDMSLNERIVFLVFVFSVFGQKSCTKRI